VLFADSPFANRLPIGDPEIVKTIPRQRVVDFYRKWYRPDLMSVIVVGDCDAAVVRSKIEAAFAPLARPAEAAPARNPVVPPGRTPECRARRSRADYTALELYQAFPAKPIASERDYRARLARDMGLAAFNLRLAEKALESSPLVVDAEAGNYRPLAGNEFSFLYVAPSLGNAMPAFRMALDELERVRRLGLPTGKLAAQDSALAQAEQMYLTTEGHSAAFRTSRLLPDRGTRLLSMRSAIDS
jgi:zinc protease